MPKTVQRLRSLFHLVKLGLHDGPAKNAIPGTRSLADYSRNRGGRGGASAAEGAGLTLQEVRCCWWLYCPRASSRGPHSSLGDSGPTPEPAQSGWGCGGDCTCRHARRLRAGADPRKAAPADRLSGCLGWDEGPGGVSAGATETFHEAREVDGLWLCELWSGVLQEGPRMRGGRALLTARAVKLFGRSPGIQAF